MAEGFEKEDWGTLAVKSSNTLVKREKAGLTGYSWSVMITAGMGMGVAEVDSWRFESGDDNKRAKSSWV